MADFPVPIGVDRMLRDIAEGVGAAAKILPEVSRSAVGAIAVHRASVAIEFELSSAARREDGSAGLGARTFLFGFGISAESSESIARNHGRIELEIVAITEPERAPAATKRPDSPLERPSMDPNAIRQAIGLIRAKLGALPLDAAERARVARTLDEAQAALEAGNLDRAAAILNSLYQELPDLVSH